MKSQQGDNTAAFLHDNLEEEQNAFVEMPLGFWKKEKVLKLKSTLYGLHQDPHTFWKYLEKQKECGMSQSMLDPCLFIGEKVICMCFVDVMLFWSNDEAHICEPAIFLQQSGVDLEKVDDAASFLGV